MATIKDLTDMYADIEVNKDLRKVHSKNLESRQPSLFGINELNDLNRDEMKKRAVEKLEQEEARKEYKDKSKAENAAERKQIADVTRAERAYRKENNIPMSSKTNPGFYHMEGGPKASSGGGGGGGGGGSMTDPMDRKTKPYNKAKGGVIKSSASKRADGCAIRGKTRA